MADNPTPPPSEKDMARAREIARPVSIGVRGFESWQEDILTANIAAALAEVRRETIERATRVGCRGKDRVCCYDCMQALLALKDVPNG